jgi:hypothetical protein
MRVRALIPLALLAALALTACDPSEAATDGSSSPTVAPSSPTNAEGEPDPLVPYSPAPRDFEEKTEGYAGDTLTLPTSDGGTLHVRLDSSALQTTFVGDVRAFSVWMTVENPGDEAWTGRPGLTMTITDPGGAVFDPIPGPTAQDLHPTPEIYGESNTDLTSTQTIAPGESLQGVTLFKLPGGYRPIVVKISLDGGTTWGQWETSFGPY